MKKIIVALLFATFGQASAQEVVQDTVKAPITIDSLRQVVDEHVMKIASFDERIAINEGDLFKLNRIKLSGYIQAQFDKFEFDNNLAPISTSNDDQPIKSTFGIRRARVKFTYEALDGIKFVLQPDFAVNQVTLKDCFVTLNDRWLNTFSLTMGQFNRLSYDVEFTSNTREFLERARVTNFLYPTERDLGAKFEANFETRYNLPLRFYAAIFNGNFGQGTTGNQNRDVDTSKDVMLRTTYSFRFPSKGLGVDVGAHSYIGYQPVLKPANAADATFSDVDNNDFKPTVGETLNKAWVGLETQVYYDILGGMALKGEYIQGRNATTSNTIQNYNTVNVPSSNKVRDFNGWYVSLTKNIGKSHQAVVRFDRLDPNTRVAGNDVTRMDDLRYSTWNFGWQYFFDEHVKVVLSYNMPMNEQSDNINAATAYRVNNIPLTPAMFKTDARDFKDNTFTIRLQAKF